MPFQPSDPSINRAGKPKGSRTTCTVPVTLERRVIRELSYRIKEDGDPEAVGLIARLMAAGYGSSKQVEA